MSVISVHEGEIRRSLIELGGWSLSGFEAGRAPVLARLVLHLIALVEEESASWRARLASERMSDTDRELEPRRRIWLVVAKRLRTDSVTISSLLTRARVLIAIAHLQRIGECLRVLERGGAPADRVLFRSFARSGEAIRDLEVYARRVSQGPDWEAFAQLPEYARSAAWPLHPDDGWIDDLQQLLRLLRILRCLLASRLRPFATRVGACRELIDLRPQLDAYMSTDGLILVRDRVIQTVLAGYQLPVIKDRFGRTQPDPEHVVRALGADLEGSPDRALLPTTALGVELWVLRVHPCFQFLGTRASLLPPPPP